MQENESNGIQEASKLLGDSKSVSRRDFVKIAGVAAATVTLGAGFGGLVAGPVTKARAATGSTGATTASTQAAATTSAAAPGPPPLAPPYKHTHKFSVITIGTASPNTSLTRASSCTMIQYKGKYYTVDAGTGAIYGFMRAAPDSNVPKATTEFALRDINAMFFTHLHQDHSTGYADIMTPRWMTGGKDMLLAGPWHTGLLHDHLLTFYRDDLVYRLLRKIAEATPPITVATAETGMFRGVTIKEMHDPESFEYQGLNIETAVLTHSMYNLGYKFEAENCSIVVSGDTSYDEDLITLAKDVDILVLDGEACMQKGFPAPTPLAWELLPPKYWPHGNWGGDVKVVPHMGFDDLAKTIGLTNPRQTVLTHFRPGDVSGGLLQTEALKYNSAFDGTVVAANDGNEFVPEDSPKN
jgi:ribonuclease Z